MTEGIPQSHPGAERALEPMAGLSLQFDLEAQIRQLHLESEWDANGRNSKTLVKYPDFRIVLTAIKGNTSMHEHKAPGRISVQVVAGHIRMRALGQVFDLPAGHLLALDREMPHDVEALEESAFLITLVWPEKAEKP